MIVQTLADITGDGATHPIVTDSRQAKWVQFLADPDNSGVVRIGGPEISDSQGFPLVAGGSFEFDPVAERSSFYLMAEICYNASNGDKLYIMYGVG